MADLCVAVDCVSCTTGYFAGIKGDNRDPGCCKKTFLPMTAVIEAEGADKCCPEITLAYFLGPFYTLCCWDIGKYREVSKIEIQVVAPTGYDKLRY